MTVFPHLQGPGFDDLLTSFACWLLTASAGWALVLLVAAVVEVTTSGRLRATSWVGCPPALRRAVLAGLGAALVTSPVQAAPAPECVLPVPARPVGAAPGGPAAQTIVVRPGDTLWHLAGARLPAMAGAADIGDLVERLHRRNREVIGPDPDLIRPGQRLFPVPSTPRQLEENR